MVSKDSRVCAVRESTEAEKKEQLSKVNPSFDQQC